MLKKCSSEFRLSLISAPQSFNKRANPSTISHQEIIILYNGRLCVCDATELQARAIIWMASKREEGRNSTKFGPQLAALRTPSGFSVKRSLQRFLHNRKKRRQATAPCYPHNCSP